MLTPRLTNSILAIFLCGLITMGASTLMAVADENERYQGVANGSGVGVFVIDTWTGTVKLCFPVQSGEDYVVRCTDFTQ